MVCPCDRGQITNFSDTYGPHLGLLPAKGSILRMKLENPEHKPEGALGY